MLYRKDLHYIIFDLVNKHIPSSSKGNQQFTIVFFHVFCRAASIRKLLQQQYLFSNGFDRGYSGFFTFFGQKKIGLLKSLTGVLRPID